MSKKDLGTPIKPRRRLFKKPFLFLFLIFFLLTPVSIIYAKFRSGTAGTPTHWIKGGTSATLDFTYNNPSNSEDVRCVSISRPSASFTLTGGSSSGWSSSNSALEVEFTGGSISAGDQDVFKITTVTDPVSTSQSSWLVWGSEYSDCKRAKKTDEIYLGSLNTGIDATPAVNNGLLSAVALSSTQITVTANTTTDSGSGIHSTPYLIGETTGTNHSSGWQASKTFVDSGLSPNTSYSYRLMVRDAVDNQSSWSPTISARTLANLPAGSGFSNITQNSLKISWSSNGNPTGTQYYVENQTKGTNSGWITTTNWTSSSLSPETAYSFRIKARNANNVETGWYTAGSQSTSSAPVEPPECTNGESSPSTSATILPGYTCPTWYCENDKKTTLTTGNIQDYSNLCTIITVPPVDECTTGEASPENTTDLLSGYSCPIWYCVNSAIVTLTVNNIGEFSYLCDEDNTPPPTNNCLTGEVSTEKTTAILTGYSCPTWFCANGSKITLTGENISNYTNFCSTTNTSTPTTEPTQNDQPDYEATPDPVGPTPSVGIITEAAAEEAIGDIKTTASELSVLGGTTSQAPIRSTPGDTTPPTIDISTQLDSILKSSRVNLSATTTDELGVIEFLAYSIDYGETWRPVTISEGYTIGIPTVNFEISTFSLIDGKYEILLKSIDNSGNEFVKSAGEVIIDTALPEVASLLIKSGVLEIPSTTPNSIKLPANLDFKIIGTFTGGVTKGKLKVGDTSFNLIYNKGSDSWTGDINITETGTYTAYLELSDEAENELDQKIFDFEIVDPFSTNLNNNSDLTIYEFSSENDAWQEFNAYTYDKTNPTDLVFANEKGLVLPAGKYFIRVMPKDESNIFSQISSYFSNVSNIFDLGDVKPLSGSMEEISTDLLEARDETPTINMEDIFTDVPQLEEKIVPLRGNDIIMFNIDPRSLVSIEQLATVKNIKNDYDNLEIIITTHSSYYDYCKDLLRRGNYPFELITNDENYFHNEIFKYRSPGALFINRRGEIETLKTGYLSIQEIINLIDNS